MTPTELTTLISMVLGGSFATAVVAYVIDRRKGRIERPAAEVARVTAVLDGTTEAYKTLLADIGSLRGEVRTCWQEAADARKEASTAREEVTEIRGSLSLAVADLDRIYGWVEAGSPPPPPARPGWLADLLKRLH